MLLRGLRQVRQRNGLSISQLAELTGLRRETITHLEHCKEEPQPYAIRRLGAALGASATELASLSFLPHEQGALENTEVSRAGVAP